MLDRANQVLFKQLLSNYEQKEYKKGIKTADTILKKNPAHGETMAMKGLILTNVDKRDEGWDYVRRGLRLDLKSHICWHVYGLLYRADRNYEEAMKCYINALKFDPDNLVVLRDLAVIQSQLRLFGPLIETRRSLVLRQPDQRGHHTALAVAYHLNKDYKNAEIVLEAYEKRLVIKPKNVEHSMTTLYHNTVIAETDPERAMQHLDQNEPYILDKLEILERRAKHSGNYEKLIDINPDCYRYYDKTEHAEYEKLQQKYPKSAAAKRRPLDWLEGDALKSALDKYLRNLLEKGVPSTFIDVKGLYKQGKADIIEEVVENIHSDEPTTKLWTLYFLAQHYDHIGRLDRAMELIDEAIAHTPTLVELHMTRARILKHMGSPRLAAEQMNVARELDLQDRFINTKCTKYYLRADMNGEAIQTVSLFLNSTLGGGSIGDLQEMQSINLLVEDGLSYLRQGIHSLAMKRFDAVKRSIDQWYEDAFDFHQYCFRKGTISAYVDMLRWEDSVYAHLVYRRATVGAVKTLLQHHAGLPEPDKLQKKKIQKIRARCLKDATREAEKRDGVDMHRKVDTDPLGDKLLTLSDALTYLRPLLRLNLEEAHALACDVYIALNDEPSARQHLEKAGTWQRYKLDKTVDYTGSDVDSLKIAVAEGCPDKILGEIQIKSLRQVLELREIYTTPEFDDRVRQKFKLYEP